MKAKTTSSNNLKDKEMSEINLDILGKIERVEAPPYLYTRIESKIQSERNESLPKSWIYIAGVIGCLLLMFNIFSLTQSIESPIPKGLLEYSEIIEMNSSNQLYND